MRRVIVFVAAALATTAAAASERCFLCSEVGTYAKHPPWKRWTTTPRPASSSSPMPSDANETTTEKYWFPEGK